VYSNNNIYPLCGYEFYFVVEWQVLFVCWRGAAMHNLGVDATQLSVCKVLLDIVIRAGSARIAHSGGERRLRSCCDAVL
jgi:hypothetical protein